MGTDKILFRPVPVPRNADRVLSLAIVPVPWHGAHIFVRASTKGMFRLVHVPENRALAPGLSGALEEYIRICLH